MSTPKHGFSIAYKLALLAGLPVAGALVLAWIIVSDAQEQAKSAAALGSVEDLAKLAGQISGTVHELQAERSRLAWGFGKPPTAELEAQYKQTDATLAGLESFLSARDVSKLPPRLARDLGAAREALSKLGEQRKAAVDEDADLVKALTFYGEANSSLISAIAALMQLSDDGELLRTISSLCSVLSIKESASQEHGALANVFEHQEFAPGLYKELVTLVTEYASNERVLYATADDATRDRYQEVLKGEFAEPTAAMRKSALETMDDDFGVDAKEWFKLQGTKIERMRSLEDELNARVKTVALAKIADTERALRTGTSLSAGVLVLSILLAWVIGRGVSRSVNSLSSAAAKVQQEKDYSARAQKVSNDELGMLTEAFNEMLSGIQARDTELEHHRQNLEKLVDERTAELQARNEAMRVVLDNVEQGLATVQLDGTLSPETSSAFARWFGAPAANTQLPALIGQYEPKVGAMTELGWESVVEDMLPWEVCLDQMPSKMLVENREYRLAYRGILHEEKLEGALLVVSDVTEEVARAKREEAQQELLQVFSRVSEDRAGFMEFLGEARRLIEATKQRDGVSIGEMMRTVHTIKGNSNIFGIFSVGAVAHELESFIVDNDEMPEDSEFEALHACWDAFEDRVRDLVSDGNDLVELTHAELERLVQDVERLNKRELSERIASLKYEPATKRLARVGERAKALTKRLGKGQLAVVIEADEIRLPAEGWTTFWSTLVHAIRNAVDHGFEDPAERRSAGKSDAPQLTLRMKSVRGDYHVELQDDGRGIDWERIAAKAESMGMPSKTQADRVEALFADGVSSAEQVTDQSGRGVGMSALRDAVGGLGGRIEVDSTLGKGTTIRFIVPSGNSSQQRSVA